MWIHHNHGGAYRLLGWSSTTARLLSSLENNLANEVGGPTGYVLPVPIDSAKKDDNTGPLDKLTSRFNEHQR